MQKLKGWSTGAISKELRGLCVKNRDPTGINLIKPGLRVESRKTKGLFSKSSGRTGMHDSWPLDLDLVAQDSLGLDLIWRVDPRSGGPGRFGAWGRRRSTPAALFCGGAG